MLRVFRRLRSELVGEHRYGRYLRYALGEIVLIVIGILLALKINDWNENRVEQAQVRSYARALAGDLVADLQMLDPVDAQIRVMMRQADELADYTRDRSLSAIANVDVFFLTYGAGGYRPYAWHRTALDQLKASGALRRMQSQDLARKIEAYDALTHHLDEDYGGDLTLIAATRDGVNRVRNQNYPEIREAQDYFDSMADEGYEAAFFAFPKSDLYARMRAHDLPLLTVQRRDVDVIVNAALDMRSAIRARVEVEFPRLRGMAAEIQERIKAEYP